MTNQICYLLVYKWSETKTQVSLRVNIPTIYTMSYIYKVSYVYKITTFPLLTKSLLRGEHWWAETKGEMNVFLRGLTAMLGPAEKPRAPKTASIHTDDLG